MLVTCYSVASEQAPAPIPAIARSWRTPGLREMPVASAASWRNPLAHAWLEVASQLLCAPDDLLALMRLVWAARRRDDGRTRAQIASFLGFRDTDHAGLRLGKKLGLKKEQINAVPYDELVKWVAACCTDRGDRRWPPRLSP